LGPRIWTQVRTAGRFVMDTGTTLLQLLDVLRATPASEGRLGLLEPLCMQVCREVCRRCLLQPAKEICFFFGSLWQFGTQPCQNSIRIAMAMDHHGPATEALH